MNIAQQSKKQRFSRKHLAAALATSAVLTAGCANMATTASSGNPFGSAATTVTGAVHGGNQPVSNATVTLYVVGTSGHGIARASQNLALATTQTDANGNFNFSQAATPANGPGVPTALGGNSYECGTGADTLLYVESIGGNTTGSGGNTINNSAAAFMAPIGNCSTAASVRVYVSEVTTAALAAAAGQFFDPSTFQLGVDGINVAGRAMTNAFATVANLVDPNTGNALANKAFTGTSTNGAFNVNGVALLETPESSKLNTVANILSACVNQVSATSATNCSTLFANATPPIAAQTSQPSATYPTATNTIQAAVYMFLNPTDGSTANRTALANLSTPTAPYQPTLNTVPTDWTIGISYYAPQACGGTSTASTFFDKPYGLAVDINGNIFISNASTAHSALVKIANNGQPLLCDTFSTAIPAAGRSFTVIDSVQNVWYGDTGTNALYRVNPTTNATLNFPTNTIPQALGADGALNIFYTTATATAGSLFKINGAATTSVIAPDNQISTVVGPKPYTIFPDTANDLWVSSGSNFVTSAVSATGGVNFTNGYSSVMYNVNTPVVAATVGPFNQVFALSGDPSTSLTVLQPSGNTYAIKANFPTAANAGGLSNPQAITLDGALNSWATNGTANTSSQNYSTSVISQTGVALSASGNTNGGYQKNGPYFNALRNIIVDQVGNVWITNDGNANSITELVGAAPPIYQPYAYGITQNRFQTVP